MRGLEVRPYPRYGLLNDKLSLECGVYKDQVNELKELMADRAAPWEQARIDFDAQIASLTAAHAEGVNRLAERTAAKNPDQLEFAEKT